MKCALITIIVILTLSFAVFLLPSIIGILAGIALFKAGHYIWAIISIVIGIGVNIFIWIEDSGSGYHDGECPYCGSGDTDGNHCYTYDDDF